MNCLEVEQILASHEEIRRNKKAEVRAKYKEEMEMLRAMREERDAYDDFIASMDMDD